MTILGGMNERMMLMSVLITIWGIRLTYNFARRGAYVLKFWEGEEDYRWEELRKRPGFKNRFVWMLFNLFFISGYHNVLIFLFTVPIITCLNDDVLTINFIDILLALIFIVFVVIEFLADQQQYDFQTEKHRELKMVNLWKNTKLVSFLMVFGQSFAIQIMQWSRLFGLYFIYLASMQQVN
jgi:steroid 5-alpha reductase family enzyme